MGKVKQWGMDLIEQEAERLLDTGADPEWAWEEAERRVFGGYVDEDGTND